MRVVVTGATGNLGTALVRLLAEDPDVTEVVGIARRTTEPHSPKVRYEAADMARDDLVPHLRGADAVVHLAWMFQPTHDPDATWRANVGGSGRLFAAVAAAGVPVLVYSSSVAAYSPGPRDRRVDESWPTHSLPGVAYGREKAYVERELDALEARHPELRIVRLRPGVVLQRAAASEQRRIFAGPLVPDSLLRPGVLPFVPFPSGLRFQALHAADMAEAIRLSLRADLRGAVNLAAEPVVDADVFAAAFGSRAVPAPIRLVRGALAAAWRLRLVPVGEGMFDLIRRAPLMDTTRARTELGWTAQRSAQDALAEFLRGAADGAGGPTAPLAGDAPAPGAAPAETEAQA